MPIEPTKPELAHALSLLRDASAEWEGRFTALPIDEVCRWNAGDGPCLEPVRNAMILLNRREAAEGASEVSVLALCERHTHCMVHGVMIRRELN